MRFVAPTILLLAPTAAITQTPIQPGMWEVTSTITDVDMPGAPPQALSAMKGRPNVIRRCVTPEDAAKGPQDLMKSSPDCRFSRYEMGGGKLNTVMTCARPNGSMEITSSGAFTPTGYTVSGVMRMSGGHAMSMKFTGVGKRLGPCR